MEVTDREMSWKYAFYLRQLYRNSELTLQQICKTFHLGWQLLSQGGSIEGLLSPHKEVQALLLEMIENYEQISH